MLSCIIYHIFIYQPTPTCSVSVVMCNVLPKRIFKKKKKKNQSESCFYNPMLFEWNKVLNETNIERGLILFGQELIDLWKVGIPEWRQGVWREGLKRIQNQNMIRTWGQSLSDRFQQLTTAGRWCNYTTMPTKKTNKKKQKAKSWFMAIEK